MRYRFFGQRVSEKPIELKIIPLVQDGNCLYGPGDLIEVIAENAADSGM
jgi:hypothetical protein